MSLNYQDVQALLKLLDESPYNELTLQTDSFTLNLQRNTDGAGWQQSSDVAAKPHVIQAKAADTTAATAEPPASEAGLLEVRAPMIGTWYRAPTPGAEPFIQVGSVVNENSIIGIIEAMKLMTSVPAKLQGAVVEILATDATLVEKGQLLMRVRPQ
ncbi:MAG: acetyl-CoA carboxylase biotin carboxyl carrier protein [Pseudomonadota bacterium]